MNNVLPVAAVGAATVLVNRWLRQQNVPVVSTVAGLSNRIVGGAAATGLRVVGSVSEGVGVAAVGAGGAVRGLASQVDRLTAG